MSGQRSSTISLHVQTVQHFANLEQSEQALFATLTAHNRKEEMFLYPLMNSHLSADERTQILDTMESEMSLH